MKQNPEFIGPHHEDDKREEAKEMLFGWSEKSKQPIDGELEKTEEEIQMVYVINEMIAEELSRLGIDGYEPLSIEKIHLLTGEVFKKGVFNTKDLKGFFLSTNDVVCVNKDWVKNKAELFATLLHELIHRASKNKFYVDGKSDIYDARVGYRVRSAWKDPSRQRRLGGFNEIMTDLMVYKILLNNQGLLAESFGVTKDDIQGPIYGYMNYVEIVENIAVAIGKTKGIPAPQAFDDLERGQFQNSLLVLKDVEKAFGKGSLEILSLLGILKNKEDDEKLEKLIGQFFAENDAGLRENLKTQILEFVQKSQGEEKEI